MATVVIIDQHGSSRRALEDIIGSLHDEEEPIYSAAFEHPQEALDWLGTHSADLILTDFQMPGMDAVALIQRLRALAAFRDLPIVVVTSLHDRELRYRALEAGATDFLTKPVDYFECRARCRNLMLMRSQQQIIRDRARWLEQKVAEVSHRIHQREQETLLRLAKAGEYRDEGTGNHVIRMAKYSSLIAQALGLSQDECEVIELAAPMHDIGKIGIPDRILRKSGPLTEDEFRVMQTHTIIGYEILKDSPSKYLQLGAAIALRHHEKFDGSGYPHGVAGGEIPLAARIVAVADVYDALTTERSYKTAWSVQDAFDFLSRYRGTHFDPQCVDALRAQLSAVIRVQQRLRDHRSAHGGV